MGKPKKDERWYLEVLESNEKTLLRYVRKMTSNNQEAQEIVQNTFLKLWSQDVEKVKNYVRKWLYTVARNEVFDFHRRKVKMGDLDDQSILLSIDSKQEELYELGEIFRLVATLPKKQQELISLKFQSGFSYNEISEITGYSVSNVGFLIHQAITALRDKMEATEEK